MIDKPVKYRIFIDEVGTHNYSDSDAADKRYLGLTGVFFQFEYYSKTFHAEFETFKNEYFNTSKDPDNHIIMHRKDILEKRSSFFVLQDKDICKEFDQELLTIIKNSPFTIISVLIDKKFHREQYGTAALHPYHYCLNAILERYCGFLNYCNAVGDVMAESRGGEEDKKLKLSYQQLLESGTLYRNADFFRNVLTSQEIKIKPKEMNINGIQFADILAHPCFYDILISNKIREKYSGNFGRQIREIIQGKYNKWYRWGKIDGYGRIFLGNKKASLR